MMSERREFEREIATLLLNHYASERPTKTEQEVYRGLRGMREEKEIKFRSRI